MIPFLISSAFLNLKKYVMRIYRMSIITIFIMIGMFVPVLVTAQDTAPAPCSSEEARLFDFWVGEWELDWVDAEGKAGTGTNRIEKVLGGCVIQENFSTSDGSFKGMSVSTYNPALKKWQQTWVDNNGSYLDFTGGFEDGKMTLSRELITKDGKKIMQRMIFFDIKEDAFTWNWEGSQDGGATWNLQWQINYKRKK